MIVRIARVKVGHRQAFTASKSPTRKSWAFCFSGAHFNFCGRKRVDWSKSWLNEVDLLVVKEQILVLLYGSNVDQQWAVFSGSPRLDQLVHHSQQPHMHIGLVIRLYQL